MAVEVVGDFELEKIRAEIKQEKQMKEMLEQSSSELRYTIEELEKRYDGVVDEGNEWKTRCETQQEMNDQLDKQIFMLQSKVQEAKSNLKDAGSFIASSDHVSSKSLDNSYMSFVASDSIPSTAKTKPTGITINIAIASPRQAGKSTKDMKNFDDLSDATPHMVRMLEKEKNMLHNQMRDIEWRLDQESKAYHKAHEERKTYSTEIHAAATRNRLPITHRELEPIPGSRTPRDMGRLRCSHIDNWSKKNKNHPPIHMRRPRYMDPTWNSFTRNSNIPEDQRILDPKRGPIRKTAAVKSLPSLEMT
ncbi:coiled-coil domain-containing protein 169-like isoform X2 [Mizuhopecten yessoensis]|uniref:coiled-coil domain-containing protein 169-like isoform X2 n=1 Tax=Mizuhopecten yessoensis TaxID=6573 RepID=UPI000B45837F|nr:coiled-coil domain-containing protein 169-like isoform X2 [Mizuhopecten yessoensis]